MNKTLFAGHFHQQPLMNKCAWLMLAALIFLVFFFTTTVIMSFMYGLDEAPLGF